MSKSTVLSLTILLALIFVWGCEHRTYYEPEDKGRFYTPQQIPIKPGMILKPEFTIIKSVTLINAQTNTDWQLLGAFTHQWWGNLRMWTDTAVGLVTTELKRRGVAVTDELPLILKLTITPGEKASNLAGLITRECPMDTDRDGIPDYLDRCPDTPQTAKVDSLGCPLDTDKDSLPDDRDYCPLIPQGFMIDNMRFGEKGPGVYEDMSGRSEIYLVSSRPADTVMGLFKNQLERKGISIDGDRPGMIRFHTTVSEWRAGFTSIRSALKKEGVQLTERMPRILQLAVTDASMIWETREIGCRLNLRVITGDGDILDFQGTNYAINLSDSCNGAVTKEVTAMFNNPRIRSYLTAPIKPKDSDCDGVPDALDECPGTPKGVKVDSKGCPRDTDGDGVSDYLDKCPGTPKGAKNELNKPNKPNKLKQPKER